MLVKDINRGTGVADPAANRVFGSGDDWFDTVLFPGNTFIGLPQTVMPETVMPPPAMPEMDVASQTYPVQVRGDFGMLASLCLAPAYSAFAVGDNLDGCGKIWAATEFALSLVAKSHGWPCQTEDDHFALLKHLQAKTGKYEDPDILAGYLLACSYHDGAEYGFMEDYVIKYGLPYVRRFITELLSLAQGAA